MNLKEMILAKGSISKAAAIKAIGNEEFERQIKILELECSISYAYVGGKFDDESTIILSRVEPLAKPNAPDSAAF